MEKLGSLSFCQKVDLTVGIDMSMFEWLLIAVLVISIINLVLTWTQS